MSRRSDVGLPAGAASEKRTIADRLDPETLAKLEAIVRGERDV